MTKRYCRICQLLVLAIFVQTALADMALGAQAHSQGEWENIVRAAEQEGEVVYSASGSHRFLEEFHKRYPKIRTTSVSASCSKLVARIMTERRAGKNLTDVVRCGLTSATSLYRGKTLQPIDSALILPEVRDASKWW